MICPKCCNKLADNSAFCPKCGTKVTQSEDEKISAKKCARCGAEYPLSTKYCRHDGQALQEPDLPLATEDRQEAAANGLTCPVCGTSYPLTAKFCRIDGAALRATPPPFSEVQKETRPDRESMHPISSPQWQHAAQISQEPQKHGHKTLIWSLLAVLLLGGGGVGGYYFHSTQSKEREREAETTIQPVQAQPPAIQETAPQPPPISAPPQQRYTEAPPPQPSTQMVPGVYPNASLKLLSDADLSGKSKFDLKIMRNEIFARRGYIFRTPDMQRYFGSQSWYAPRLADVTGMLTQIEKTNVELIKKYERISPR